MERPKTRYARSGELSIAYQVVGDGPRDLVYVPGAISHLDFAWDHPGYVRFIRRLAAIARVIVFDRRGMGLSDPVSAAPAVEERVGDIRAVMDAAGSESAVLLGASEGSALACYFAATEPERVSAAILYGALARMMPVPDYPWTVLDEDLLREWRDAIAEAWGEGLILTPLAPSKLADEREREWWGRYERACVSPAMQLKIIEANLLIDIRDVLHLVQAPTLLLHRRGDFIPIEGARYMAERIPGARLVEMEGEDHWPWIDDPDEVCDHIEEFVTGVRRAPEPDRVLATVLFTDIVASTERAAEIGDRRWRELLDAHEESFRRELKVQGGGGGKDHGGRVPRHLRRPGAGDSLRQGSCIGDPSTRDQHSRRHSHRGMRAPKRGHRRHRGPHRRPGDVPGRPRRSARIKHGEGPYGGLRHRVRGARRARAKGRPGLLAPLRCSLRPDVWRSSSNPAVVGF
jgi:pimeloyl-ACP methyl ester carboxylesterase